MPTPESKEWYAIYTRPRWEKKVYDRLTAQNIAAYCPLNKVTRQWSDRKKVVEVPLFTSYVFVQITPEEQLPVRMTPGVVNFVYWQGRIARIRAEEMAELQAFVANNEQIRLERLSYEPGDHFEIENGVLKGQPAVVQSVRKNKLELILMGLNMKLVVDYTPISVH